MSKRAKSEGTIYYSEAKGKWIAQLPAGPDGRRPYRTAETQEEAADLLFQMRKARDEGRDLSRRAETISEVLDDFIDTLTAAGRRASTIDVYRTTGAHVTDAIGALRIEAVTLETVQRLANTLHRKHGITSVRKSLELLHRVYERLIPERVSRNPVDWKRLELPKHTPRETPPLEAEEIAIALAAADHVAGRGARVRLAPAWWLAALLGLRRGEIAGASWRDLNWDRAELHIKTQVAQTDDGTFQPGQPTKTPEGVRLLPIGPRLLARLREHWQVQQAERRTRGPAWREHGLIICQEDGTPYTDLSVLNYDMILLSQETGLHLHPHRFRHSFATLVADEGYSESVIAALLGHKRRGSVTTRYVHAKPKVLRAAVEAVEQRVFAGTAEAAEKEAGHGR
jgi:integrase